tara:strand:+ start:372 stop:599 length:228 start_codon:yes stop_codon:yes gene_type:complete
LRSINHGFNVSSGWSSILQKLSRKGTMVQNYIDWEKRQIEWWKEKFGISDHGVAWISIIKGIVVGIIAYHFLLNF